jgi:ATP-dependent RNA helicase DHX8/PRP22
MVKRGQDVWVKVISTSGQRLSLSMRDVDQSSGEDLLPMGRGQDAVNPSAGPGGAGRNAQSALHGLSGIKVRPSIGPIKEMRKGCPG